jgi:membrane protein DedA with SNARE-associated domain
MIQHFIETHYVFFHTYGYLAVFFLIMVEDFGIPSPGEITLISVSIIASQGGLNIALVLFLAWCGAVIGDNIGFGIGHFGGGRLLIRYGNRFGLTQKRFESASIFFNRYGGGFVLIARFIEVARQLNGIIAGSAGMKWWKFILYNSAGAALWVFFWGYGSYALGNHFFKYIPVIESSGYYGLIAITALLFIFILWWVWKKRKKV